jgi:hypothetical protein
LDGKEEQLTAKTWIVDLEWQVQWHVIVSKLIKKLKKYWAKSETKMAGWQGG